MREHTLHLVEAKGRTHPCDKCLLIENIRKRTQTLRHILDSIQAHRRLLLAAVLHGAAYHAKDTSFTDVRYAGDPPRAQQKKTRKSS